MAVAKAKVRYEQLLLVAPVLSIVLRVQLYAISVYVLLQDFSVLLCCISIVVLVYCRSIYFLDISEGRESQK
jgi:hypothetical protein